MKKIQADYHLKPLSTFRRARRRVDAASRREGAENIEIGRDIKGLAAPRYDRPNCYTFCWPLYEETGPSQQ